MVQPRQEAAWLFDLAGQQYSTAKEAKVVTSDVLGVKISI